MKPSNYSKKIEKEVEMKRLDTKPINDGYRMPGEFERHKGTYMIWPERPDNWRLGAKPAQKHSSASARKPSTSSSTE